MTTFTTEVPHHLPHRGLSGRSVTDLDRNHTDDPVIGTSCGPVKLRPVIDYERAYLMHGSPLCRLEGASKDVSRLCHVLLLMGLSGTK